jgi:diacylglycerol kinase (ATP)
MRWLAIINPHADHHTVEELDALAEELKRSLSARCAWTSFPKHATVIARNSPGYEGYVAVGGDGTISETLNGLDHQPFHFGFVPAGTGNGLARDLNLLDEREALRALRHGRFTRLDLIRVRYRCREHWSSRFLVSTAALGYVAGATRLGIGPCKKLDHLRYAVAAFLQAFRRNDFQAAVRLDGDPWQEQVFTNLVVHNTQHIGPFWLFPEARLNDGKLNVLAGRLSPLGQLVEDLGVLTRTFFFERSQRYVARHVEIILHQPIMLMLDGDLVDGVEEVQFQILPGRLLCCTGDTPTSALEARALSARPKVAFVDMAETTQDQCAREDGRQTGHARVKMKRFLWKAFTKTK